MKRKQKEIKVAVSVFFQDASVSHPFYLHYTGPSLKLIWHLKMDGWNTCFLLGWLIFRAMLVLGSVIESHPILLEFPFFHSLNWDMFDGNSIPSACLQSEEV